MKTKSGSDEISQGQYRGMESMLELGRSVDMSSHTIIILIRTWFVARWIILASFFTFHYSLHDYWIGLQPFTLTYGCHIQWAPEVCTGRNNLTRPGPVRSLFGPTRFQQLIFRPRPLHTRPGSARSQYKCYQLSYQCHMISSSSNHI